MSTWMFVALAWWFVMTVSGLLMTWINDDECKITVSDITHFLFLAWILVPIAITVTLWKSEYVVLEKKK